MVAIARRTFAELNTEAVNRLGGVDYTGFDTRVQYWLTAAYLWLSTVWHHYELDASNTSLTLSTSSNSLALPADLYAIFSVRLRNPSSSVLLDPLTFREAHGFFQAMSESSGVPTRYTRHGSNLYVNVRPNLAYAVDLFYYRRPAIPDFATSDTSELDRVWDELLMEGTVALGQGGVWRPDLSQASLQLLAGLAEDLPQPSVASGNLLDLRLSDRASSTHGGAR